MKKALQFLSWIRKPLEPLDDMQILEDLSCARIALCTILVENAHTDEEAAYAQTLMRDAQKARVSIPMTVARRRLLQHEG